MRTTKLNTLKQMSKFVLLFIALLSIAQIAVAQEGAIPPPEPLTSIVIDDPRYIPGPVYKFVGSVIVDKDGNAVHTSTQNITNGRSAPISARHIWDQSWTGVSNLWISGNWIKGYSSVRLLQPSTQSKKLCTRVDQLYSPAGEAYTHPPGSDLWGYCGWVTSPGTWVTSPELGVWSDCNLVDPWGYGKVGSNNSGHLFRRNSGEPVQHGSYAQHTYGCR
jgi:hypothetical protein